MSIDEHPESAIAPATTLARSNTHAPPVYGIRGAPETLNGDRVPPGMHDQSEEICAQLFAME